MLYSTFDQLRTSGVLRPDAETVGDDAASLRVYVIVVLLVAIGALLIGLAVWLLRQTRPDREFLAPLERMEARRWRRLGPQDRRRSLDEVRPDGASPIHRAKSEPVVDREFASARPVRDFSDLVERGPAGTAGHVDVGMNPSPPESTTTIGIVDMVEVESTATSGPVPIDPEPVVSSASEESVPPESASECAADETAPIEQPIDEPEIEQPIAVQEIEQPIDEMDIDESTSNGDDTGEHPSEADVNIPLMPGEGLLRRKRTDADQG